MITREYLNIIWMNVMISSCRLRQIVKCHVFVRASISLSGMGMFVEKIKGPLGKKTSNGLRCPE